MAFRYTFKLRSDASPHLYLHQIKEMVKGDDYMHPLFANTLKLMKKTRMSFIRLATTKEIVFVPERNMHFERAMDPQLTGYTRIDWTPEEIESAQKDPKKFYGDILNMYFKLGYEVTEKENIDEKKIGDIIKLTEEQIPK